MPENRSNKPYEIPLLYIIEKPDGAPVNPIPVPVVDPLLELLDAIRLNDLITAKRLIEEDDLDINQYDQRGLMPVHYLGLYDVSEELFSLICRNTEDPLATTVIESDDGISLEGIEIFHDDNVLHIAARSPFNYDIAINFQNRFNYINSEANSQGNTPIDEAITFENTEMINFMLEKGVIDLKSQPSAAPILTTLCQKKTEQNHKEP